MEAQVFGEDAEQETAKFNEEDIDAILSRRAQRVVAPSQAAADGAAPAASTFSTATFVPDSAGPDIDYDDPLFWEKLMPQAKKTAATGDANGKDEAGARNRRGVARLGFDGTAQAASEGGGKSRLRQAGSDEEPSDGNASGYGSGGGGSRRAGLWTQADMKAVKRALLSLGFGRCSAACLKNTSRFSFSLKEAC